MSPRSLHSELMCPICLDMLKNTMTTKECLHRFCADCIITALRSGCVSAARDTARGQGGDTHCQDAVGMTLPRPGEGTLPRMGHCQGQG